MRVSWWCLSARNKYEKAMKSARNAQARFNKVRRLLVVCIRRRNEERLRLMSRRHEQVWFDGGQELHPSLVPMLRVEIHGVALAS